MNFFRKIIIDPIAFKKRDILGSNPIALNEPVKWNTSIFLIDDVKSFGRIYGFSFFFINLNPIKLILMRPDYTSNIPETFTLVYTWLIYPNNLGREDVMVQDISQICEIARPGDKIGLYLKDQSPAVAHQYDYRVKNRIIQNVYQNDLIINKAYSTDGIKYPCVFSIRFYMDQDFGYTKIDNYSKCPINSGVPLLYSTEEKYETIGYDLVSIDEYSPWQLSIFLFVDPIESFGYLYGFSMYFVSKDPVTLCLLRPNYAYSTIYSYKLVQKWTINPENLGKSHIMISAINQQCFMVRKGDQIGILIDDDSPSIAHQYNDAIRNNIIPLDSEELEINRDYNTDGLQYNCIFSLKIHINKEFENLDEYSNCSDENKNPKEIEKEENTGEEVGYNLISFDEPVKWNVSSFIFEDGFMSYGRIFGFTFYFIKMDPVKVLLWRPTYENFEILSYKLIHIWTITPPNLGLVDIHLQENSRCISIKPNDRLGIFIDDNTPSIAHQYDYNVGNSIIQNIDENDLIVGNEYTTDGVGYPCIFSMKAYSDKLIREGKIDQTSDCPIDITIPKQKEKSENAGRFEQVGYKPLSKHESVNWNISAFIFAQDIQRKGRLFAFTFYFLNTDPLKVLLFRPKYYNGQIETYNLIHIWDIIPPQTGLVNIGLEDIKQQCVECKVNDRIGIYINDDSPAVTHQYDYNIKNVIIQNVYESDLVIGQEYTSDGMGYPCVFSVQGYICTEDTETSLYNCPAIDNLYEAFESAKYYTNGFDLLKSNQIAVREKCAVAFSKCINSSGILFSFSMYLINTNPIKLLLWRPSIVNHFLISDLNQECVFVEYEDRLGIYLEDNPLAIAEQINENVVNDMVSMEDVEINKVYYPEGVTKYTFSLQAHIDIDLSESNLDKYSNCLGSKFKGIETKDMKEIPLPLIIGVLQKFMDWLTNQ
ncbi:hypothetical protein A3Q56_06038 [Intoshia linei]|uniref:Uncharacterized protein n=1 Tax=Intoshia linei TaxID=1819745 RepID=A0A177AXV1_9BILA|nr:hypothetical protein A3Q56_06038 [Intoshia linei]